MTDIPEDIKRVARDLGEAWFGVGHHDSYLLAAQVEAALSSERERCAQIAEQWLVTFGEVGGKLRHTTPQEWANSAVEDISTSIRSPERAGE